tara:strand:+ start:203 stop:838 length:636 start_codon:yes stop_codon:yes gene_type:complete
MLQPIKPVELMKDPKLTKSEFKEWIGVWEDFVPPYLCEKAINHFEETLNGASIYNDRNFLDGEAQFATKKLGRDDISILLNNTDTELASNFNQYLQACVLHYIDKYSQLKSVKMFSSDLKMQKTEPEGGYHVWHYESSNYDSKNRELVWAIYLNDLPEGEGETEFLHQHRRIRPKQGTVVIWPACMTHVHRGLTVYSQDKYILTGWYIQVP